MGVSRKRGGSPRRLRPGRSTLRLATDARSVRARRCEQRHHRRSGAGGRRGVGGPPKRRPTRRSGVPSSPARSRRSPAARRSRERPTWTSRCWSPQPEQARDRRRASGSSTGCSLDVELPRRARAGRPGAGGGVVRVRAELPRRAGGRRPHRAPRPPRSRDRARVRHARRVRARTADVHRRIRARFAALDPHTAWRPTWSMAWLFPTSLTAGRRAGRGLAHTDGAAALPAGARSVPVAEYERLLALLGCADVAPERGRSPSRRRRCAVRRGRRAARHHRWQPARPARLTDPAPACRPACRPRSVRRSCRVRRRASTSPVRRRPHPRRPARRDRRQPRARGGRRPP